MAGKAKADKHSASRGLAGSEAPVVSMDYAVMGDKNASGNEEVEEEGRSSDEKYENENKDETKAKILVTKFVITLSRPVRFQKRSSPKPLTANMVAEGNVSDDEPATDTKFTVEEWIAWIQDEEGQAFVASGNALPTEGQDAIDSVISGKGKGKSGWHKGKGKGKDSKGDGKGAGTKGKGKGKNGAKGQGKGRNGACNTCGEMSHRLRVPPEASELCWQGRLEHSPQQWQSQSCTHGEQQPISRISEIILSHPIEHEMSHIS